MRMVLVSIFSCPLALRAGGVVSLRHDAGRKLPNYLRGPYRIARLGMPKRHYSGDQRAITEIL